MATGSYMTPTYSRSQSPYQHLEVSQHDVTWTRLVFKGIQVTNEKSQNSKGRSLGLSIATLDMWGRHYPTGIAQSRRNGQE
ncbi:hypothetical protein TNCV_2110791 [Trichonephila clavipes]|nr:hypothetical protein TNCV_2110791 [Trichonephila clavipes]